LKADGSVMVVEVNTSQPVAASPSKRLFDVPGGVLPEWGVTKDGNRFLFAVPVAAPPPFTIVHGWQTSAGI
jgi:hypothetical protein